MSAPRRNYSHYVIHNALVKSCETGLFGNEVHEVTKRALNAEVYTAKLDYKWYMKTGKTAIHAVFEVLKQEILRTLMDKDSGQPKTRLVINETGGAYVLSKAVVRASALPANYFLSSHYAYH